MVHEPFLVTPSACTGEQDKGHQPKSLFRYGTGFPAVTRAL